MAGKVWFVTGASGGLGRVWAEAALRRGDRVAATARRVDALGELSEEFGDAVLTQSLDVTDRAAVFDVMRQVEVRFGRLDVVVSNAGYSYTGAVEELDVDEVRANFETNFIGSLSVVQAALPLLRASGGGRILLVSSIGGIASFPTGGAYVPSKFAVEAMGEALAAEVSGQDVAVTLVEPGSYATGFGGAARSAPPMARYDEVRQAIRASFDPATLGDPAATVGAILSVVDDERPPRRLILGDWVLDRVKAIYADRIDTWEQWSSVSAAAQR